MVTVTHKHGEVLSITLTDDHAEMLVKFLKQAKIALWAVPTGTNWYTVYQDTYQNNAVPLVSGLWDDLRRQLP